MSNPLESVASVSRANASQLSIAHIMPWAGIGGVEVATLRIVDVTRDRFRHVAFCRTDGPMVQQAFQEHGAEVVLYEPPEPSLRHFSRFYRESKSISRKLRDARIDIAHFAEIKSAAHCGLGAMLAGVKRISHVRNTYPKSSWRGDLELLPMQEFVFVSKESRDNSAFSVFGRKVRVLYDAVEAPLHLPSRSAGAGTRLELSIPQNAPVIGMVARINPQKDYITLAHAASIVLQLRPDTVFLLVGDNANVDMNRRHYDEVVPILERLGIRSSFVFTGHRTDVDRLITAMDFCVLSTHREGFPLSIIETMAQGKAVVATSVGGIPEIIRPGENGFLVPHMDAASLAERLLFLVQHPEEAQRMGLAAAALVQKDYSPQRFADEITEIYTCLQDNRAAD